MKKCKCVMGIDPGKNGAACFMDLSGRIVQIVDFTSPAVVALDIEELTGLDSRFLEIVFVAIEMVGPAPKQGRSGIFTFGANFGFWTGIAQQFQAPISFPYPQTWQARRIPKKKNPKDKPALPLARYEYPEAVLTQKQHADRADAIYIADWARNQWRSHSSKLTAEWKKQIEEDLKRWNPKRRFGIREDWL